jgi:putative transposase
MAHGHHRKNIRLKEFDYTTNGAYFVTFCTYEKQCTLGKVTAEANVDLSSFGRIIHDEIANTNNVRTDILVDDFVVMPNHVHVIVFLMGDEDGQKNEFGKPRKSSLASVINLFKSYATRKIRLLTGNPILIVWQGRYHDHVIRNEQELQIYREYIRDNPGNWLDDEENPDRRKQKAERTVVTCRWHVWSRVLQLVSVTSF